MVYPRVSNGRLNIPFKSARVLAPDNMVVASVTEAGDINSWSANNEDPNPAMEACDEDTVGMVNIDETGASGDWDVADSMTS